MTAALALVLALALHSATSPAATSPAAATAQAPRAVADKTLQDLGTIGVGTEPVAEFSIKNDGAAPLTLAVKTPLPAGLRVVQGDQTVAPSASGVIRLALDTFKAGSGNEWHATVTTNDPEHATLDLAIKADVRTFIAFTPASSRISFVQYEAEGGTTHVFGALDDAKMDVLGVDSPVDYIRARWHELKADERKPDLPGRQWQIDLTILGNAPVGPIGGYVIVRTTHPKQPRAFLPVTGFVRPLFAVTPPAVTLASVPPAADGATPLFSLVVKNFGTAAVELTDASSDIAGLEATIVPTQAGHVWRVEVRMTRRAAGEPFKGTLTLKTGSAKVPELKVPVQGTWAGARQD